MICVVIEASSGFCEYKATMYDYGANSLFGRIAWYMISRLIASVRCRTIIRRSCWLIYRSIRTADTFTLQRYMYFRQIFVGRPEGIKMGCGGRVGV